MTGSSKAVPAERGLAMERLWLSSVCSELQIAAEAVAAYFELLMVHVDRPIESVSEIHRRIRQLSGSLSELASITAAGPAGAKQEAENLALEDVVEIAAALVYGEATRKQQRLAVNIDDEASVVEADARTLHRLLVSLLAHAVRATPVGGVVTVSARRRSGSWVVGVSDVGGPVDAGHSTDLLAPFAQFRSAGSSSDEALGPGLALAAGLVEASGGDYWIERQEEGGNTFFFSLVE